MPDDLSLFGDDEPAAPQSQATPPTPVADWQIDLLRKALDARGLTTMAERQQAIETAAGRTVESLRALTQEEALSVLNRLGQAPSKKAGGTSAWTVLMSCRAVAAIGETGYRERDVSPVGSRSYRRDVRALPPPQREPVQHR